MGALQIRPARPEDLATCAAIEAACFPPEQAACPDAIRRRIAAYPDHFLVGLSAGEIVGYAMGPVIRQITITDDMFADTRCHDPKNPYQAVFSLAVRPDRRRLGYGRELLGALIGLARRQGRKGVTLTCRDYRVAYYESFGFQNRGVAASVHGGVTWYDMVLLF